MSAHVKTGQGGCELRNSYCTPNFIPLNRLGRLSTTCSFIGAVEDEPRAAILKDCCQMLGLAVYRRRHCLYRCCCRCRLSQLGVRDRGSFRHGPHVGCFWNARIAIESAFESGKGAVASGLRVVVWWVMSMTLRGVRSCLSRTLELELAGRRHRKLSSSPTTYRMWGKAAWIYRHMGDPLQARGSTLDFT